MAGVPNFIEVDFEGSSMKPTDAQAIIGREVGVRISKAHYRYHTFVITGAWGDVEKGYSHFVMERKDLQQKEGGEE